MVDDLSKTVVESHSFLCRGINKSGKPAFSKKNSPTVIVNIFGMGRTEVLCNYQFLRCCNYDCSENLNSVEDTHKNCVYIKS